MVFLFLAFTVSSLPAEDFLKPLIVMASHSPPLGNDIAYSSVAFSSEDLLEKSVRTLPDALACTSLG